MEQSASGAVERLRRLALSPRGGLGAILLLFLAVALWGIGSPSVPSTPWPGGEVSAVILPDGPVDRVYFHVATPEVMAARVDCEGPRDTWVGDSHRLTRGVSLDWWPYLELPCKGRTRLLVASDSAVGEVYLFDGFQKRGLKSVQAEFGDPSRLFDEQDLLKEPPNYFHGTVYDERIYVRTAYEYLTRAAPFTHFDHPPLGKDFIALGMAFAGNSPWGWRVPQVVSGALLIVVLYLLGSQLGGARVGLVAALLLALTPLHYTYSRLALLDIHLVLFGALAVLSLLRFFDSGKRLSLFLAFTFLGAAMAVKWTAWPLFPAFLFLLLVRRPRSDLRKYGPVALAGILAAGLVYLAAYAPYYAAGLRLGDVLSEQCCGPRSIVAYHSADYLFNYQDAWNSPWWSWPLLPWVPSPFTKLAAGGRFSEVLAIANPLLGWLSLPVMAWALWRGLPLLRRKLHSGPEGKEVETFLVLSASFFAAWLSFSILSRATYFYHYYLPLVLSLPVLAHGLGRQPLRFQYFFIITAALIFLVLLRPALGVWM